VLRRSTHGPARRSQAPRRATRGPWPRLRYRLNSSRPFASARTAADRERQAGPICPFIGGLAPAGIPSQALAGSPRGRVPASALRGARSTLGLRVGRHGGAPLVRLRIAPLVHTSRPPRRYQLVRAPRRGSPPALHSGRAGRRGAQGLPPSPRQILLRALVRAAAQDGPARYNRFCLFRASPAGAAPAPAPPSGEEMESVPKTSHQRRCRGGWRRARRASPRSPAIFPL
jgi:hypothetical protein